MRAGKIVIVDDNEAILKTLRTILSREFKTVLPISQPSLLPALLQANDVDVVVLDMNFGTGKQSGADGLFWLDHICEYKNPPAVVLITAYGDVELAVAALKKGATDFVVKPWENEKLLSTVISAFEKHHSMFSQDYMDKERITVLLLNYFLNKYATIYGKPYPTISTEIKNQFSVILWRRNIEEFEELIEKFILLGEVPTSLNELPTISITLEEMEKQFIQKVLHEKGRNLTLSASQLNISRQTLYNKMKKYDL